MIVGFRSCIDKNRELGRSWLHANESGTDSVWARRKARRRSTRAIAKILAIQLPRTSTSILVYLNSSILLRKEGKSINSALYK